MRIEQTFEPGFDELYNDYNSTAKGKELLDLEGISRRCLDIGTMSKNYFNKSIADSTLDENANSNEDKSNNNYSSEIMKGLTKLNGYYLIWHYACRMYGVDRANTLIKAIWDGDVYFHDASKPQIPYCLAYSTTAIMIEGMPYGQLHSSPPKHAKSFMGQVIETTMNMSQEFSGAIAPGDLIVNYAWYAKKDNLTDDEIIQDFQTFVHIMNNKFRVSNESPFVNISIFDRTNLEKIFEHYKYPDGSSVDFDYVQHIQDIFARWLSKGDPASGLPYRFPVATLNISCDKYKNIIDESFLDWTSNVNLSKGCFNIYINDGNKISSCCRMINDAERMPFRADSFGNGGLNLGSTRVVTIDLPRIAIKSRDMIEFNRELERVLYIARDLLQVHRECILEDRVKRGFLKFYSPLKWLNLDHLFSTIGIIGVYETNQFIGLNIRDPDGIEFTKNLLTTIEDYALKFSHETGHSFNVEEIPGESVAHKLVAKDRVIFGKEAVPCELYSNQYIPLIEDALIPERIDLTGQFQDILSGGGILHLNVIDEIKDPAVMKKLIIYAVKHGVSHLAINYGFGICENGHTTVCGNSDKCIICGGKIKDHITRVIGYFAKVSNWGKVRRDYEFPKRVFNHAE